MILLDLINDSESKQGLSKYCCWLKPAWSFEVKVSPMDYIDIHVPSLMPYRHPAVPSLMQITSFCVLIIATHLWFLGSGRVTLLPWGSPPVAVSAGRALLASLNLFMPLSHCECFCVLHEVNYLSQSLSSNFWDF